MKNPPQFRIFRPRFSNRKFFHHNRQTHEIQAKTLLLFLRPPQGILFQSHFQFTYGKAAFSRSVADVQLHDFLSGSFPDVSDFHAHSNPFRRRSLCAQGRILELRITESVSEGEQDGHFFFIIIPISDVNPFRISAMPVVPGEIEIRGRIGELQGKLSGSFPEGLTAPNNTSAVASPIPSPPR